MSLYNEVRPLSLKDVRGQEVIKKLLLDCFCTGRYPNGMLFIGTRGTGKTSVARIFSKTINCENPTDGECCNLCQSCREINSSSSLDVYELDAASNNSVDDIRNLLEKVQYKVVHKYRVFIVDEVHMLSISAFNALLKVLEEPPENVIFILCSTELHKIPATILSRCRRFVFKSIEPSVIVEKLKEINAQYKCEAEEDALQIVAKAAKGSMRDAESIYEQFLYCGEKVTAVMVQEVLGLTDFELIYQLIQSVSDGNSNIAISVITEVVKAGKSLSHLIEETTQMLMDIAFFQMSGEENLLLGDKERRKALMHLAYTMNTDKIFHIMESIKDAYGNANQEYSLKTSLLTAIYEVSRVSRLEKDMQDMQQRISAVEDLKDGSSPMGIEAEPSQSCEKESTVSGSGEKRKTMPGSDVIIMENYRLQGNGTGDVSNKNCLFEESVPDGWENGIPFDQFNTQLAGDGNSAMESKEETVTPPANNNGMPGDSFFSEDFARLFG